MANVNIYLNFPRCTEEAFNFYKSVFGGEFTTELQDMFWGSYYGTCVDKFGIQWMFNCMAK